MGLLAPIGLIGAVIVSFVGAFVTEVKRQFDGIKAIFKTFDTYLNQSKMQSQEKVKPLVRHCNQ